jgi:hypothetical protein
MANNIIITPGSASIQFSGSVNSTIYQLVDASGSVTYYSVGSGSLFSVTDKISGSVMSVNDEAGVPIFEVFSDTKINLGTWGDPAITITGSKAIIKSVQMSGSTVSGAIWVDGGNTFSGSSANPRIFGSINSYNIGLYASNSLVMLVSTGSRVGVGTANPSAKFHITGVGTTTGQSLLIEDAALNPRFMVTDTGSIAIGKNSATGSLHIKGSSVSTGGVNAFNNNSLFIENSSNSILFYVGNDGTIGGGSSGGVNVFIVSSVLGGKWNTQNNTTTVFTTSTNDGRINIWNSMLIGGASSAAVASASLHVSGGAVISRNLGVGLNSTGSATLFNNGSSGFGGILSSSNIILDNSKTYWGFSGSAATIWTLPSMSINIGLSYKIYNRGSGSAATLTLTGSSAIDKLYTTTTASSILINPGEKYEAYNDGTYWILFTL